MADGIIEQFQTRDVFEIIKSLDINLIRKPMKNKEGRFIRDPFGKETIMIDSNLNEYRQRAVAAHELGHAILHTDLRVHYHKDTFISKDKIEFQANKFAAEILIPDALNINFDINDSITIKDLSSYLKVPEEYIELKFNSKKYAKQLNDKEFYIDLFIDD